MGANGMQPSITKIDLPSMTKINLPEYVQPVTSRGKTYYYYRRGKFRQRLPVPFSAEFQPTYEAINKSFKGKGSHSPGSLGDLISQYKASPEFTELAKQTKSGYSGYLDIIAEGRSELSVNTVKRTFGVGLRNQYADKPTTANRILASLSALFSWGADHGFRDDNPFRKIKKFKLTGTIKPWTMSEISKFRKVAYKELNEAIAFALFTGQREGDICKFTWSQDKFRHLEWFKQGKTGAEMFIPIHPLFRKIIDGIDKRAVVILTTKTGHPWRPEYLSKETTKYAKKAGLDGCVFHGLRKTATVILADAGCTTVAVFRNTRTSQQRPIEF